MKPTKEQDRTMNGLLREIVAQRDGEQCLWCGKMDRLQMSHIYPKGRYRGMKYEPDNLKFLCVGCHLFKWHKSPMEAKAWLETAIDKKRLERLHLMALDNSPKHFDPKLHIVYLTEYLKKLTV